MIVCLYCKEQKNIDDFPNDPSRKNGKYPYCKRCKSEKQKKTNAKNTEKRLSKKIWKCIRCEKEKSALDFFKAEIKPRGMQSICLECRREDKYISPYTEKHKEYQKKVSYPKVRAKRNKLKEELILKKGGKCEDCQLQVIKDLPSVCFDFHHTDPKEKDINVSKYLTINHKIDILLKEIEKTIVLCANCHRKKHFYY